MPPKKRKAESTDSSETSSSDVAPKPKRKKVEKAPSKTTTKKKKGDGHKYLTPTLTQIRAKADTKFSFYKANSNVTLGDTKLVKDASASIAILSASCKGTEKSPYDVELEIPQSDEKVGEWKGSCNCDSSKNKKKVCSHQLAVLMEWEDDERLTHGLITQSDKVRLKKAPTDFSKTYTSSEKKKINKEKENLSGCKNVDLQSMLRFNDCTVGGTKAVLEQRIGESIVFGVIPRCTSCGGGRPKWLNGYWICEGYTDDTDWQNCSFVGREIERVDWKVEDEK